MSSFKSKTHTSKGILMIVHTNLCGPIEVKSYKGDKYIMFFFDDYSRMMTIMFLKQKSDAFILILLVIQWVRFTYL